jgi:hypothetical protein
VTPFGPLADVIRALDTAGIEHMVVGSVASSQYGPARATQDVDLLISAEPAALERFLGAVDHAGLYVPDELARAAVRTGGQFNVIDYHSPWKIDLMMLGSEPFDRAQFGRRHSVSIDGLALFVASAEDTILAKLRWHRIGGSDRQLRDVSGILDVMASQLDLAYIDRWATELDLGDLLEQVQRGSAES